MKIKEIRTKLSRKAISFQVGGFRPDDNPYSSWIGKVLVAESDASWPQHGGKNMVPVCQLNLTNLPYKPAILSEIAFITCFIAPDNLENSEVNIEDFLILTYKSIDTLQPIRMPEEKFNVKAFQLKENLIENDYPCYEDCNIDLPEKYMDEYEDYFPNANGIKIGGWPTLLQGEINWSQSNSDEIEFAFQIDSVAKAGLQFGDGGILHIGRNKNNRDKEWYINWQTL